MSKKTSKSKTKKSEQENEILPRWDLSEYYTGIDDPQIEVDLKQAEANAIAFAAKYKGKVASLSGDELATALEESDANSYLESKAAYFGNLLGAIEQDNKAVSAFNQGISERLTKIGAHTQFFGLELNKMTVEELQAKQDESPRLQVYAPVLEQVQRFKPHTLDDSLEELLLKKEPTSASGLMNRLYAEQKVKMRFDFRGEKLTEVALDQHLDSPDRKTRRKALQARSDGFTRHIDIPTFVMNTLIKDKQINDEIRGYDGDLASRNLSNNVEADVVNTLIDTVIANYSETSHRYNKLRAQMMLGQDTLAEWDLRGPLPDKSEEYIPWEKAKDIVLSSYREFSPQMADIAQKFFDEGWIDAPVVDGKRSGAFSSSGFAKHHPHVLVNYTGKPRDVMTLAHELGHGVHQYLEKGAQGDIQPGTPLTLAETASLFGEALVFDKLLKEIKDPTERKVLLAEKVSDEIGSIVRQASWVDFERKIHEARREGELSPEQFANFWNETNKGREGPAVTEVTEGAGNSWSRVPHMFRTPFYMYAYSFGNLLVNSLFKAHEEGKIENFEEKYIDALKAGGTKHHSEFLKPFGLDASEPSFWQNGLDVLIGRIDQLEVAIAEEKALKESLAPKADGEAVQIESIKLVGATNGAGKNQVRGQK